MPLLGYHKQFADLVATGAKRQTIRPKRKHPIKRGNRLYHYCGLRTKQARKLCESTCKSVEAITIGARGQVTVAGRALKTDLALEFFAVADGFRAEAGRSAYAKFIEFFKTKHGLPFAGQLIKW